MLLTLRKHGQFKIFPRRSLGRILIHPPSLRWPLSLRGTSGERLGRGAPSAELSLSIEFPSPVPSPHSSVVGRGNRPAAGGGRFKERIGRRYFLTAFTVRSAGSMTNFIPSGASGTVSIAELAN